jgi:enoyl-CoA hydratase/carnithine racemase
MTTDILTALDAGILTITFNRPQARNAFTFEMYERVGEICGSVPLDGSVKVIVMTGAGDKAFGAGTDISQFRAFSTPQDALNYESRMDRIIGTIERCPVPTIAAIAGACTGGGAAIATACDIRIAAKSAKYGFPIARTLGNCISMSNLSRVAALAGIARAKELIFTARLVEAEEGLRIGLYSEVLEDHAALMTRANTLAQTIAGHAPLTLRATKEALRRLREQSGIIEGEDLITMCYMSADFREGMDAFLTKRPPNWTGT